MVTKIIFTIVLQGKKKKNSNIVYLVVIVTTYLVSIPLFPEVY